MRRKEVVARVRRRILTSARLVMRSLVLWAVVAEPVEARDCQDIRTGQAFVVPTAGYTSGGTAVALDSLPERLCVGSLQGTSAVTISDGAGGAFVSWLQPAGEYCDLMFQHVLASGEVVQGCPEGGRAVCNAKGSQSQPTLTLAGNSGVWSAWKDCREAGASAIYLVRLDSQGVPTLGYPEGGIKTSEQGEPSSEPCLVGDGQGGAWLLWRAKRSGSGALILKHFGGDGALVSGSPTGGRVITTSGTSAAHPIATSDGAGGLVVSWSQEAATGSRIYVNRIGASGDQYAGWPAGGLELEDSPALLKPMALETSPTQVFMTWTENFEDSCSAKFGSVALDGTWPAGWGEQGGRVPGPGVSATPALAADGAGGVYATWLGQPDSTAALALRLVRFGANGDTIQGWPTGGLEVPNTSGNASRPHVLRIDNGVLVSWNKPSERADGQFLDAALASLGQLPELASADAWPDLVRLAWRAPNPAPYSLGVERSDTDGSWVRVGKAVTSPEGLLTIDDREVTPGSTVKYRQRVAGTQMELVTGEFTVKVPASVPLGIRTLYTRSNRLLLVATTPAKGPVRFELFDVQGRRLLRDDRTFDHAGEVKLDWSIPDGVNKGVYFARIAFGGQSKTRKFIIKN